MEDNLGTRVSLGHSCEHSSMIWMSMCQDDEFKLAISHDFSEVSQQQLCSLICRCSSVYQDVSPISLDKEDIYIHAHQATCVWQLQESVLGLYSCLYGVREWQASAAPMKDQ